MVLHRRLVDWLNAEAGQGLIEYALIGVLVSIVATLVMAGVGDQLGSMFSNVANSFPP